MRKIFMILSCFITVPAFAAVSANVAKSGTDLDAQLQKTKQSCGDISNDLAGLKSMAGIGAVATGAGTVAYRAILVKLTYTRTGAIANGAIFINLSNAGTRTIADSAVAVEPADAGSTGIADGAVTFNLATARTAAIVNGLRHCT